MAGKITDLAVLTGAGAATTDLLEAIDVSDVSMAATGTNKKLTLAELVLFLEANGLDARYVDVGGDTMSGGLTVNNSIVANTLMSLGSITGQSVAASTGPSVIRDTTLTGTTQIDALNLDPTAAMQPATKQYVDNAVAGLSWKEAVYMATTVNGAMATAYANGQLVDGVTLATGDRILIKNQTAAAENGIYVVNASGAPTRATDADSPGDLLQACVFVMNGAVNPDTAWVCTNNSIATVGVTALVWAQFASSGGSVPTARTINTTAPLSGGGPLTADLTLVLNDGGVTPVKLSNSDFGDFTVASGVATIDTGVVSNAKLATMAANTIKMNNTAGVASPTDVTIANAQTALAIPALPVTVTNGGSGRSSAVTAYGLLAAGTTATGIEQTVAPAASGFLKTTSTSALPAWAAIANTDVSGLGTLATKSTVATADITNDAVDNTKLANMSASSFKGNNTGSIADPIDMTVAQAKTLLAITESDVANLVTDLAAKQPIDPELTAIAGLVSAADQAPYFTGAGTASLMTVTSAARTVLDDTTVAAMLVTLGGVAKAGDTMLGTLYLQVPAQGTTALRVVQGQVTAGSTADFDLTGAGSVSVPTPTTNAHASTKLYVDTQRDTRQPLDSDLTAIAALTATTGNMILSAGSAWTSAAPATVKTALSLDQVTNTSDANKPVSTAQATADSLRVLKAGDAMTGPLTMKADSSGVAPIIVTSVAGIEYGRMDFYSGGISIREPAGKQFEVMVNGGQKLIVQETVTSIANLANFQAGAQITGAFDFTLTRDPSSALQATTKQYVDAKHLTAFTATVNGAVPAPTTATGKFLKDDGTWAAGGTPGAGTVTPAMLSNSDFGDFTVASGVATLDAAVVTNSKLANAGATTIKGNPTGSPAAPGDMPMSTVRGMLGLTYTDVGGLGALAIKNTIATADIDNNAVTNAKLATMVQNTIKGRGAGSTGDPQDLTAAQATAILNTFTATLKGLVPPPNPATGLFLKDDGTWAAAGGSTDVMWVGTSAPSDPTVEVWYDTDEVAGVGLDQPTGDARYFPVRQTVVMSAATSYTLALTDENKLLGFSASSAVSVTVPLNSSVAFAQGTRIDLFQFGTGQITIIATGGVTIRATPSLLFRAQGSAATLIKTAGPDTWLLSGDLA